MDEKESLEESSGSTLFWAFFSGAAFGASLAILLAPEPGSRVRERLNRGAKTAQNEFSSVASGTKDAVEALSKDARQSFNQTATRLNAAIEATKAAIKAEPESSRNPD